MFFQRMDGGSESPNGNDDASVNSVNSPSDTNYEADMKVRRFLKRCSLLVPNMVFMDGTQFIIYVCFEVLKVFLKKYLTKN